MPFISVNTTVSLTDEQKDALKTGIGQSITRLPNKTEKVLMVDISDSHTMYFGGEKRDKLAFIDVRMYGDTTFEYKKDFTEALFAAVCESCGLAPNQIFMTISPFQEWGSGGTLK
ncbi:MAG: phenylpyruvate tautomerase MIF-related protein [Butyricicoccaceae bacterium]